jgi:glycerol dehydrogenase
MRSARESNISLLLEAATVPAETIHSTPFEVDADDVVSALASIERLARGVRQRAGLPDPVPYVAHH